ncbi:MAG TPA: adenylosuccinate lyase [Erysipelotrichaceae bacterium]|nr:MAG: adenylosuccinate lyase [Firmicutes bacterium GWE2_51_13]HBZ41512.1 adenylosuccinate lyase [Erysipelotrichaceae bacterium]
MIQRYSRPQMAKLWNDEERFQSWLDVELAVVDYYHTKGLVSDVEWDKLHRDASFKIDRILEIEEQTRHDVVAFTRAVSETLGDESRWIHYGMTSTDVVDTAYAVVFKKVNAILRQDIKSLMETLKKLAIQYKHTPCIGRTHGVHADITCFGLKFALWYDELNRQLKRFESAAKDVETGKISGAVGTFANTSPDLQDFVCKELGIHSSNISTQTLQRDRHAHYLSVLALIGSTLEKIGVELRHLQRTEVREVEEGFKQGQKGSSAMPHKRNPISSENIAGCARVLRGYMVSAYEDIPLWHERDISHSSAERIILPDATILLDYMLDRMNRILSNLTVFEDRMLENIDATHGVIFAQRVMTLLIERKGMTREVAYDLVQPIAMEAWTKRTSFRELLLANKTILSSLSSEELDEAFSLTYHLRYVDAILLRVGIEK